MGKGNIVDDKSRTGNAGRPKVKSLVVTDGRPKSPEANPSKTKKIAMSQQRGDAGRSNQSAPQKLVQLVGYRDPKPRRAHARPAPMK